MVGIFFVIFVRSDLGFEVGYEVIGLVDFMFLIVGVWVKVIKVDIFKVVVEVIGEGLCFEIEGEVGYVLIFYFS